MTHTQFKTIRIRLGLTERQLARILRVKDKRTIRRWGNGEVPVTGPVSYLMELLDEGLIGP